MNIIIADTFKKDFLKIFKKENNILVPIFIVKKSNKRYWNNLIITNEIQKILEQKYLKNFNGIKNNNFQIYN